ncbi:fatty acid desaturase family protein [Nocardia sp. alder85J]|uniref:fatty acid desaturase family protein n=1 Tax=Nocardia sp. alder85J TaxID=2862949 RepID=UPI001CD453CC|nr:acyl-CoA desaturase [Nocardia sp. alder85J]MCX4094334.1 acyl-CoA desaturase [Nocardia sp. alder85J]
MPVRGSEYAELLRRVRTAGLLNRRLGYYAWKSAITVAVLAAGWTAFALVGDSWWQLVVAVVLAAIFPHFAFLGHDAGHRQIFATRRANQWYGLLFGNLAIGVSIGWWTSNHNRHHAHPNTEDADPDVLGVLAHSADRARTGRGVRRLIFRYQAWLFFPMLLLEGWSLHLSSGRAILRWPISHRAAEGALLLAHAVGYLGAVFLVLSPVKAVVFILVQQGLFGLYMGSTFAPNHKGMAVLPVGDATDFLRRQVLTARNVRGGPVTDTALGGLNYQIEHHLFPAMPRVNLRRARPLVMQFCAEAGVPYHETGLFESYAEALGHLDAVGRSLRAGPEPVAGDTRSAPVPVGLRAEATIEPEPERWPPTLSAVDH